MLSVDESLAPALVVAPCYTGSDADPEELRALRSAPGLVDDGVRAHTFLDQQRVFDSPYGENRHYWKGHFVRELPDELLDELLGRIVALGRPARRDPDRIAARRAEGRRRARRGRRLPPRRVQHQRDGDLAGPRPRRRADRVGARDRSGDRAVVGQGGGYVNYMQADEPIERVRAAFGAEAFERLQALKRRYDPNNVLRRNQNIPPL